MVMDVCLVALMLWPTEAGILLTYFLLNFFLYRVKLTRLRLFKLWVDYIGLGLDPGANGQSLERIRREFGYVSLFNG